jgi:2-polyprenyl-3-methyl-5-hydroxy-6-metoxy-1,4-benzoquinol methylase
MRLEKRFCPLCGGESCDLYLEENFQPQNLNSFSFASRKEPEPFHLRLFLCKKCDLIYANPAFTREMIEQEYENAAFDSNIEASYAAKTYSKYLPQKNLIKSALDIGTGGGEFLLELQKSGVKDLHGIEPSRSAIATSHPNIQHFIKQGFFDKKNYAEERFDLISCFQTFEHVTHPLQLSKDAHSLLKNDGRFFVVTHNFRGVVNKILGKKSPIYDIEHFQLFSSQSLRQMLEFAGFRTIKIFPIINTYPLFYFVKLFPSIPAKKQIISFIKEIKIGYLPISLSIGNIAAIATK